MKIVHLEGSYQGQLEKEVDRLEAINKRLLEACKFAYHNVHHSLNLDELTQIRGTLKQAIAKSEGREL